jgi:tRNA-dihydrouridine synthase
MFETTGCDAVMIGRGAIGHPWLFERAKAFLATGIDPGPPPMREQVEVYYDFLADSIAEKGERKGLLESRRQLSTILKGLPHVAEVRSAAMRETTVEGIRELLDRFLEEQAETEVRV